MAKNFKHFSPGLNIVATTGVTLNTTGDIKSESSDGKLYYYNGSVGSQSGILTEVHPATVTNKTIDADLNTITNIENADVKANAGIVYSKLNLTNGIVNADVNSSAAIAYSKLNLSNSVTNNDIATNAAIAYSKLNLANSIVNADINTAAAIGRDKIASGSASHVIINDGSGNLSSESTLAVSRGGTNISSYVIGDLVYASATQTISKLGIGSTGQVLKVASGIPSWGSPASGLSVTSKTANYNITASDDVILVNATSASVSVTLPDSTANSGKIFYIKKTDASFNRVVINTTSSQTIDGSTSTTLNTTNEDLELISDGSNWQILERRIPSITTSFTPTGTWTTNTTYAGYYRRVGDCIEIEYTLTLSGAPDSVALSFNIPFSLTIDTVKTNLDQAGGTLFGNGLGVDAGTGTFPTVARYSSNTVIDIKGISVTSGANNQVLYDVNATTPMTWASGDFMFITIKIPISGWNG